MTTTTESALDAMTTTGPRPGREPREPHAHHRPSRPAKTAVLASLDGPPSTTTANAATLVHLAAQRATGALLGDAGTVYLMDGEVVHAESPNAPPLDVLLGPSVLAPARWQEAVDYAGGHHQVARYLVDHAGVAPGELEICHLGALFDAAFFALAPDAGPARFRYGAAHWLGPIRPVPARLVERETRRRRALLDHVCPCPPLDTAPLCRSRAAKPRAGGLARSRRAVLDLVDGVRTATTIARLLRRPAFHVLVDVRRLAAAGYLDAPRTAPPAAPPALPAWIADVSADPDLALLRRLRDALEARL
ncbi:transcriptional regulator [Yinghuangia seranimata]|uniref:transcriptional regulator n=1 Tax=Yinghuangia seranimata TaxID=408067 RepID=UPI00248C1D35|nr:transcriptional regulator [Yinghuangia seranimata]MDI2130291.1 transcriptional regulator [Yinghuangia seranimata]